MNIKLTKGDWAVVRWCCTSGQCIDCYQRGHGTRQQVVQMAGLSKASAEEVAKNWGSYGARAVQSPGYALLNPAKKEATQ